MYRDGKKRRPERPLTGEGRMTSLTYLLTGEVGDFERLVRPHGEILAVRWSGAWVQCVNADLPPPRRGRHRKRPFIRPTVEPRAWVTIRATAEGWRALYRRFQLVPPAPPVKPRMRGPGVLWRCTHTDADYTIEPVVCRAVDAEAAKVEACRVWGLDPDGTGADLTTPERDLIQVTRVERAKELADEV